MGHNLDDIECDVHCTMLNMHLQCAIYIYVMCVNTICNTQYSHYRMCTALKRRRVGSWDIVGQSHKLTPPPPPPVPALQARCSPKKQVYIVISLKDIVISLKDTFISLSDDLTQISYNSSSLHHQSSYKTAAFLQQVFPEISYILLHCTSPSPSNTGPMSCKL